MNTLADALKNLIKSLGIEDQVQVNQILLLWPSVVGKKIAEVSQAQKIEHNILFVKVTNDSWRQELLFLKKNIIDKLNKKVGKEIIRDIRLY
ncbi:MAG: DUF721 domain-containing protein [Candidatus Zhuqueibacterota bacterium]